jgi:class 3 adenylate cyclase
MAPRTKYVDSEGGAVAYQVVGDGPDLVYVPNWLSNIEIQWDEPSYGHFLQQVASFSRLISFDKRGSGLSEQISLNALPTLEQWMDDILAVMDAVGSERAALVGCDIGGMLSMLFAASYPERTSHLVLVDTSARLRRDDDYPIGIPSANLERFHAILEEGFGDPDEPGWLSFVAPDASKDPRFSAWFSRMERLTGTPRFAAAMSWTSAEWDLRPVLGSIRVPTLVLHHQSTRNVRPDHGRYLAEHIEGARYLDLPGADALIYREDVDITLSEIRAFVTGVRQAPESDRVLATVLFTDIVGSTDRATALGDRGWRELLDSHDRAVESRIAEFRGQAVKSTGDGVLATFDGPARGIRCAAAIARDSREDLGVEIRAGLHTGEIEVRGADIGGIAVHTAARVMAAAQPSEILVSRTVKDLVAGSGLEFDDRGNHELKGIGGDWPLYALTE